MQMPRKRSTRRRRGSTLVMVAFLLVAIMGVTAIALDIGRFYVVSNELQTALDAGALAGAYKMQKTKIADTVVLTDTIQEHVREFLRQNRVDNAALTSAELDALRDSVRLAFWDKGYSEPRFDYAAMSPPRKPNAVVIRGRKVPNALFAHFLGQGSGLVTRRAVAWVANINSSNCVRPWSMDYRSLYNRVARANVPAGTRADDFTTQQLNDFNSRPVEERRFIYLGPNASPPPSTHPYDAVWNGFNFSGNSGMAWYSHGVGDSTCTGTSYKVTTVTQGEDLSSGGPNTNDVTCKSIWSNRKNPVSAYGCGNTGPPAEGTGICHQAAVNNAICYRSAAAATAGTPGRQIFVSFGDWNSSGSTFDVRMVGRLTLVCYYVQESNNPGCSPQVFTRPTTGYPYGTMIFQLDSLGREEITPETMLGADPGLQNRLILVK